MTLREQFRNLFTPEELIAYEKAANHSFTLATLTGDIIPHPLSSENLFEVVLNRKRYVVDPNTHEHWQKTSARPENQGKAFIIGKTVTDENFNTASLFFSRKVHLANRNLFVLHLTDDANGELAVMLERIDEHYKPLFKPASLKRSNPNTSNWEPQHKASVEHERAVIMLLLGVKDISELGPPEEMVETVTRLGSFIQRNARQCLGQWILSSQVARHCYAMLLASKCPKTVKEFSDPNRINVFGDTQILRDALFLEAAIYTNDGGLKEMASYVGLECVNSVF